MTREHWKDLMEAAGMLAIVGSLIFVALEIKTNTESNIITIEQNYSCNWMLINQTVADNGILAELIEKGLAGEPLSRAELRQFDAFTRMYLTQSFHMLRLYDQGLITEEEVRGAFRATRELAQQGRLRERYQQISNERRRGLVLDPDGLDKWLNVDR